MKVHLVDGTFELFRCFHGAPRYTNKAGKEVGAVRGLLHTLLSLLKGDDVSHLAVAFDQLPTPRGPLGDDPGTIIRSQAGLAFEAVRALGIRLWPMYRFQADDALASGAKALVSESLIDQIVICTTDTDLFQCIRGSRVVVLDRIHKSVSDERAIKTKYGILPWQFPDYMAISGAPTKGIPGIPGWGIKSTALILQHYERLEEIPDDFNEWPVAIRNAKTLAGNLSYYREEAQLIRSLATLYDGLPIDCNLKSLEWKAVDHEKLQEVIDIAEAADLYERLERWDRY